MRNSSEPFKATAVNLCCSHEVQGAPLFFTAPCCVQDDVEFKALFDGTNCNIEAMKAAGYTSILHVAAVPLELLVDTEKLKRPDAHIIKQRAEAWQREKERQSTSAGVLCHPTNILQGGYVELSFWSGIFLACRHARNNL